MKSRRWYIEFYDVGQYPVRVFCFDSLTEAMEALGSEYYEENISGWLSQYKYKVMDEKEYYERYRGSVELWWDGKVRTLKKEGITLQER